MFSKGKDPITKADIENIPQEDIAKVFLGISGIPLLIQSPLRNDRKPSLSIYYSGKSNDILFKDFSTGESGNIYTLLQSLWRCTPKECYRRIKNEFQTFNFTKTHNNCVKKHKNAEDLQVKIRDLEAHDIEYWESYGVSHKLLQWAQVYPISHYFIIKDNKRYTFGAPKYAYAFFEYMNETPYIKVYKPYSKEYKWYSNFNSGIISLYNRIPKKGKSIIICSSLKDSLCIISNLKIPCICPQGEGYSFPEEVAEDLKNRFEKVYILFDNDEAGILNGKRLAKETGFQYLLLPNINQSKDVSDLYKSLEDKSQFKQIISNLLWKESSQ